MILDRPIFDGTIAVVKFETTGLKPSTASMLEAAVAALDPVGEVELILDTLVNPGRPVDATEIHGISDADVEHAPTFRELAGDLLQCLAGRPISAYNAGYCMGILKHELTRIGLPPVKPLHFCMMELTHVLGLKQWEPFKSTRVAAKDAVASAGFLYRLRPEFDRLGIRTFRDLAEVAHRQSFVQSFPTGLLPDLSALGLSSCSRLKPRLS